MKQVTSRALWGILQSLQLCLKLKNVGFKDLTIVASELVKFLLVNTGYDSIDQLEKKVSKLEIATTDFKTSIKGAVTSATTASNKIDDLKKTMASLEKRVKKLE